jgi:hypothetical protein
LLSDLVGNLILVLAPLFGVEEFQVESGAIVAAEFHFVAEAFGSIEDVAFVEVVEDWSEFFVAELGGVVFFDLSFEVGFEVCGVADVDGFVAQTRQALNQVLFQFLFGLRHSLGAI